MEKHQPIEETEVFQIFEECAHWAWSQVAKWRPFERDTVGQEWVRAIDSVGCNLAEGDGRYGAADAIRFFIYARGSAREARLCLVRAIRRDLVEKEEGAQQLGELTRGLKQLNLLINYRRTVARTMAVKEDTTTYGQALELAE